MFFLFFFFNDTAPTELYTYGHTLSLHDALPICQRLSPVERPALQLRKGAQGRGCGAVDADPAPGGGFHEDPSQSAAIRDPAGGDALAVRVTAAAGSPARSEEHTSELQSLMRISYAVFCLKKKKN